MKGATMTIVDVRKLTRAEICKLGSNTAAQVDSDRRCTRTPHELDAVLTAGKAPVGSSIPKKRETITCWT
jgi:hypothetical protein